MCYNTIIEIETYGDVTPYTERVMVSEEKLNPKALAKQYCDIYGLPELNNLPSNMVRDTIDGFIKFLKKMGFKELKMKTITISD
jgi:hypothetical protein